MARPRKQAQEGDEEDQPTYVVEDSQDTLSKAEYEALVAADNADRVDENHMLPSAKDSRSNEEAEPRKVDVTGEVALVKQQVAGIGGSSKRRLAKVVGDEGDEAAPEKNDSEKNSKKYRAKKWKKMKLSFDEEGTDP